jgi:hypothetical protein
VEFSFPSLPGHIPVKWLMMLIPLLTLVFWHRYQHRMFRAYSERPTPNLFRELLAAARWRTVQVAGIWLVALLVIIGGDLRYYRLVERTAAPEAPASPVEEPAPEAGALPEATVAPPPPAANTEEQLDDMKFRYEDAFVSYFYLQRCNLADVGDLSLINDALAKEVTALGADPAVQASIFSAAQGSFESIYADTPCTKDLTAPVEQQFKAFMSGLRAP